MRKTVSLFSILLVFAVAPTVALADEVPPFGVKDIAPKDDERPEGWSPVLASGVIPDTAPTVKNLLALGKSAALEDGALAARSRSIQKEDGTAGVLSVVGIDAKNEAFTTALADAAVKHGWLVRELASPMRVAVVWSSDKDAAKTLLTWQAHLTVQKISAAAVRKTRSIQDLQGAKDVLAFLGHATRIEPEAALPHSIRGEILRRTGDADGALDAFRKVIKPDAPVPATPLWQVRAAGRVGQLLLLKGDDKFLEEAAKALERAVELEEHATDAIDKFGNPYNLACAYARLGRLDDAFRLLEKSLETGKAVLGGEYAQHYEHAQVKDPDLQSLRGDPRFGALMTKYAPDDD